MASSSSSSLIKHDVFISFRGEDIRTSFLSHLRKELHRNQIDFFVDDEKIHPGDEISSTLLQAIEESSISLVIFSENYASSTWCLNELVKVVECMKQHQRIVIPVFYNVPPSDVRYQNNSFKKAFDEHQKKLERDMKVQSWRSALKEAAGLSGFHYQSKYQDESKFIEEIVKDISEKLSKIFSRESKVLVGIDESFRSIESLLAIESSEVRTIGVWGMGGIGKTTIAEALFDKYSSQYEGSCMLKNVREQSQKFGMVYLCDKLESELLAGESGSSKAKSTLSQRKLSRKKFFIVLDDVDTLHKFEDLATQTLGSGSRIIVTTRDKHVLTNVPDTYELKGLNFENSLKLFCLRAFGEVYPKAQYEEVSKIAVNYANGIPLALEVLGSYLHSKTLQEWESALGKLKIYPNIEIFDVLKWSYEGLDELERNIFLDIVFFFKGKDKDVVIPFLESCEFFPVDGIRNLCRKALITISKNNEIEMHDLIEQMGQEIVRQESIKDPGRRSRVSDPEDVYNVLNDNKGTESVEGIMLDICQIKRDLHLDADTFKRMPGIRFLKFYDSWRNHKLGDVSFSSTPESFPKGLRYLQWCGCPLEYLPANFCAEKLVELSMPWSKVSKLWDGVQDLVNLKRINLKGCEKLVELPDFTMATNLEEIDLDECVRLGEIHPSILSIHKLKTLSVFGCQALKSLKSKTHLKSLQKLRASGCSRMEEFSVSSEELTSLNLDSTIIDKLDSSVGSLSKLIQLDLGGTRLETLPNELCLLVSLEELNLEGCRLLIELPPNMKALSRLNYLNIKVLGSYLHSKTIQEWESALGKFKVYPNIEIFDVLKLSYEGLDELERNIFLDIVFFFKGKDKDVVIPFLESCKFFPVDGIANLSRKALITISKHIIIEMHDLIEQMGREIVRRESIRDPGRCSRLSDPDDIYNVLNDNKGTESVEGIMLDMSQIKGDLQLEADTFKKMPHIRFLKFYDSWRNQRLGNVYFSSSPESFPKGLRYLQWSGLPLKCLPPNFCAEKLVELSMPWSKVSKLWDGVQDLVNLKRINLKGCGQLVNLPDLTQATNLEEIDLDYCARLGELHPSILSIHKLKTLNVLCCCALKSLKSKIHLKSLKKLDARYCSRMKEFSVTSEELTSLDLGKTIIDKLDSSVGRLSKLIQLSLFKVGLETLPNELCLLVSLEELNLEGCEQLIELPPNMKALSRLNYLNITDCHSLISLPELPPSIVRLVADHCTSLEKLFNAKGVFSLNLTYISFGKCKRLDVHSFAKYVVRTMMGVAIRDLLGEMLQYKSSGQVYYPGRKVPSWFKYHTRGSSVTVDLLADHPHYPRTLLGFILCCVVHRNHFYELKRGRFLSPEIRCRSDLGCSVKYMPSDTFNSNNVCIWFEEVRGDHGLRDSSNVTFGFKDASSEEFDGQGEWEVIRCGVCPVHASDVLDVLQNVDPHFHFFYDRQECVDRRKLIY